jgi:hypothetical protein
VCSVRFDLSKGTRIHLEHLRGETEPLLWAPCVRCGKGRTRYRDALADRLIVFEIDC